MTDSLQHISEKYQGTGRDNMVNACPTQSDPRENVSEFVSNKECKALAGLVVEGLDSLLEIVIDEIRKQEPESNIVLVDRDFLSDENITFARELSSYVDKRLSEGKKLNLIVSGDIPVVGWNMIFDKYKGMDLQVYYGVSACRQVPLCSKIEI